MKTLHYVAMMVGLIALIPLGCGQQTPTRDGHGKHNPAEKGDAGIQAALAKLNAEDRKLAEAQNVCPISAERLGSMGTPVKISLDDQSVLLCCKGCQKDAMADQEKTLAKVKDLAAKARK